MKSKSAPEPTSNIRERAAELMRGLLDTRRALEDMHARHKAELAPLHDRREAIENELSQILDEVGDNLKIRGIGTAFKTTETTATIADPQAFRNFVIKSKAWTLIDWRVNKTGAKAYVEKHSTVPPGVNFGQRMAVRLRADNAKPLPPGDPLV